MRAGNGQTLQAARWEFLNVCHIIEREQHDPKAVALVYGDRAVTYGQLRARSRRVANGLIDVGVGPDDRVAVTAKNRPEYFEVEFGVGAAAAIFVPMSWRLTTDERIRLLNRSGTKVLFADSEFAEPLILARAAGQLPGLLRIVTFGPTPGADEEYDGWTSSFPADRPVVEQASMRAIHEVIYTSGTTGQPKGVKWSHGTVLWNTTQQIVDFGLRPSDSNLVSLDLNYIGGRHDFTLAILMQGGTVHLMPSGGFDPAVILEYLADHHISHVLWVPTMLHDVLQQSPRISKLDLSSLRMIMCGGSSLSAEMTAQAQTTFPTTDFVQVFGLTEGGGTPTYVPKHRLADKVGSAGLPSIFNEIRVVAEDGSECASGEVGQILIRGAAVTPGYWDNDDATAELVRDGWLYTGDLGRRDDEGFLFVSGRAKDLIITGGMNVFPADVEHVIAELPQVDLVSVIGLPDARWGERICAVIRRAQGAKLTEDEVIAHCRERVAGYKKPKDVVFVDDFPMTISGKIQKNVLAQRILEATRQVTS